MTDARHSAEPATPEPNYRKKDLGVLALALVILTGLVVPAGLWGYSKLEAWVGRPDSHAHISTAAATPTPQCAGMPVSGANVMKYRASGRVSTKGNVPKNHWLLSNSPDQQLAKKGLYRWTLRPWQLSSTSYAVYLVGGICHLEPLRPAESKTTYRLDGRRVPGTDMSFQLPLKATFLFAVMSSDTIDPHAAN